MPFQFKSMIIMPGRNQKVNVRYLYKLVRLGVDFRLKVKKYTHIYIPLYIWLNVLTVYIKYYYFKT